MIAWRVMVAVWVWVGVAVSVGVEVAVGVSDGSTVFVAVKVGVEAGVLWACWHWYWLGWPVGFAESRWGLWLEYPAGIFL